MSWSARDVMRPEVRTVGPDTTLADLDRRFIDEGVSGFPVVEGDRLVGIVSRSDVVRHLSVEQSVVEMISDYYRDIGADAEPPRTLESIGCQVGIHLEELRVKDVMIHGLLTVSPADPLREVARILVEKRIHRLPVVEEGRLVGIVSTMDLVRLFAEDRTRPA